MEIRLPFQVKYTVRYNNGTPEKDGRFAFGTDNSEDPALLKAIVEREPNLNDAEFIFGSFWSTQELDPAQGIKTNPIFSFTRTEIEAFLGRN
ncbi:MAG: hypothetical protein JWP00_3499 [Chloroflexi bacterium]|nr:hypothetical protein [Chloroflexota bacterium]